MKYIPLLLIVLSVYSYACRIVITPRPTMRKIVHQPITVKKHHFNVEINNGVAVTTLESIFYNPNHRQLEGTYLFPLPKGASISNFSMWIDGKEMPAELLDATKARNLYISIVRKMIDPGLLEFVGRETFKLRIFPIPARGTKRIKLSYTQVLPSNGNLMHYVYPLTTVGNGREDIISELSLQVNIKSQIPLKSIFSPSHKVKVVKKDKEARITYEGKNVKPAKDFTLYVSRSTRRIDLSFVPYKRGNRGHFLLMLAPKVKKEKRNPKDVVFVFDTSGSMAGEQIQQAKAALKYCLNSLAPEDRFNMVLFSTEARRYQDNLISADKKSIKTALDFVEEEVYARGGTNIDEALSYALEMAPKSGKRPFMLVFLTDGKPTIGNVDSKQILAQVKKHKVKNLRLFTFGVGTNLNTHLLDRLAEENSGTREYVAPGEDIEIKVSSFFDKISFPVLSNIKVKFPSTGGLRVEQVYPRKFADLFHGSQINILGSYKGTGDQAIKVTGLVGDQEQEFVFEVSFPEKNIDNKHIPRLWAVRKVGFMLDQIRLYGESAEVKKEIVRLAKKFGIVTPYTSYLVVEDNIKIGTNTTAPGANVWRRDRSLRSSGRGQSAMKSKAGKEAVEASKKLQEMKNATVDDDGAAKPEKQNSNSRSNSQIRKIDEKTFYLTNGVWYDSEYKSGKKIRIRYMSEKYLQLLENSPEIGKYLAIGKKAVIVFNDKTYEIVE